MIEKVFASNFSAHNFVKGVIHIISSSGQVEGAKSGTLCAAPLLIQGVGALRMETEYSVGPL